MSRKRQWDRSSPGTPVLSFLYHAFSAPCSFIYHRHYITSAYYAVVNNALRSHYHSSCHRHYDLCHHALLALSFTTPALPPQETPPHIFYHHQYKCHDWNIVDVVTNLGHFGGKQTSFSIEYNFVLY